MANFNPNMKYSSNNCYMQEQPIELTPFCRNFRDFVFQICPKLTYEARKEYEDEKKKFYQRFKLDPITMQFNAQSKQEEQEYNNDLKRLKEKEEKVIEEEEINRK